MEPSTSQDRRRLEFRNKSLLKIRTMLRSWCNTVLFILKTCETPYTENCTIYFRKTFLSVWTLFSKKVNLEHILGNGRIFYRRAQNENSHHMVPHIARGPGITFKMLSLK